MPECVSAFAPGRVCLIGEHTDYNEGLALAFAIAEGVTVHAHTLEPGSGAPGAPGVPGVPAGVPGAPSVPGAPGVPSIPGIPGAPSAERVVAYALDFDERDELLLAAPSPAPGWRAFVRGTVAELTRAGCPPPAAVLQIAGEIPRGAGLSSSAALEVALSLALLALTHHECALGKTALAKLCSRVENEWAGAQTGLLDQLTSLEGEPDMAIRIDFQTLQIDRVPLRLDGWRLVTLDSGEPRENASSGYNQRRAECTRACELLGVRSLRETDLGAVGQLPAPLRGRVEHVLGDNARVDAAIAALRANDLPALGRLLDAAHASLRDDLDVSTPAVEAAVRRLLDAGAAGARLMGGGFGGSVLGLLAPDVATPAGAREVRPCAGARVLDR